MKYKLLLFLLCSVASLNAKVKLQPMFSDNMVLQQQTDAPIWGEANAGANIQVTASWDGKTYKVKADNKGAWMVKVATPKAGGPFTINISDGKPVILHNVMIGEVWLCTGQSNMEMPVVGPSNDNWGKVNNYKEEAAEAQNHPNIRMLKVNRNIALKPQTSVGAESNGWQICSSNSVAEFSATGYFFGRNIEKYRNVPIGLIETCWGGTPAEAWTSSNTLKTIPHYADRINSMKPILEGELSLSENDNSLYQIWIDSISTTDHGVVNGKAVWSASDFDDSSWQEANVPCDITDGRKPGFDGIIWMRKSIDIPKSWQGKNLTLRLGTVDDDDVTYFNGTQIGLTMGYNHSRVYIVPAKLVKAGNAVITVKCIDTGGYGGFRSKAEDMSISLNDKSSIALAGNWKYKTTVEADKFTLSPDNLGTYQSPTVLFNGMINPLIPYSVKGAIWYQGENNASTANYYNELLMTMINDWRVRWGYDFPFYIVQLANYKDKQTKPEESDWAELREAQLKTLALKNTGLAVIIDIGEEKDIHPKNKQEVGRRLALAARNLTYGEDIPYSGPIYSNYRIEGNTIRLYFNNTDGGLKAKGDVVKGFTVAGADHKFYWADAKIDGNTIVVTSKDVALPLAVRYAWANNPICNLYNGAGLPASPFRTDDWPGVTYNK